MVGREVEVEIRMKRDPKEPTKRFHTYLLLVPIYIYVATILTNYGYISYFRIPASSINASIVENTLFFFGILQGLLELHKSTDGRLTIAFFFFIGLLFYGINKRFKTSSNVRDIQIGVVAIILLFLFQNFGLFIAQQRYAFETLSPGCPLVEEGKFYIIHSIHDGNAIVTPVDARTQKMDGGYKNLNVIDIPCSIVSRGVGKVQQ